VIRFGQTSRPGEEDVMRRLPLAPTGRRGVPRELAQLAAVHRRHCSGADLGLLREAYQVAAELHQGQTRESGKPFITHPAAVARVIAELGLDTTTVVAAVLHDTVEDTSYTLAHLRAQFGPAAADLVDGVTKLDKLHFGEVAEAETFRKMILAARNDIRVLIIKIADRLHNLRTLGFKPRRSQVRTATVTRDIIIPFADRLGLYAIRRELEDLVFATLEPDTYQQIDDHLRATDADRRPLAAAAQRQLATALRGARIRGQVHDRPRHYYSIYREMLKDPPGGPQNPPRLVVVVSGDTRNCYRTLGLVHRTWRPVPGRFKDMIATPKYNLYQSLHTTVVGPGDQAMDVLIRTRHMHTVAEVGIAAELADRGRRRVPVPARQLEWLERLHAWQQEAADSDNFLDALRSDLAYPEITIVAGSTPVTFPSGSTCVDLAYQLDPVAADRLIGARVNGRLITLSTPLADGDQVELIHAQPGQSPGPSRDWLASVRTPRARLQISQAFSDHQPTALRERVRDGRATLANALRRRDRALPDDQTLTALAASQGLPDQQALFLALHQGRGDPEQLADQLVALVDQHQLLDRPPK
jgi:GTP pyrophosphokinase